MSPVSVLPALVALCLALATSFLIERKYGAPTAQGRYSSIDGLRGYLAFFVFLHHSSIWFFYLRTGKWEVPPSNLYTHLGQSSVTLFFMITGFLFFTKIIEGRSKRIDWLKLFISRFFRLTPLYFFVLLLLLITISILSRGQIKESPEILIKEIVKWLTFTIFGMPDINSIKNSWIIIAGVTWSLPYEWAFYFSLPLMSVALGTMPPKIFIAISLLCFTYFKMWNFDIHYLSFIGGITAAALARYNRFHDFATSKLATIVATCLISIAVIFFPVAHKVTPVLLLALAFSLIASGNNLFGLLTCSVSRTLGESTYSIYLLHGIFLFFTFTIFFNSFEASRLSATKHWIVIWTITPFLIILSSISFKYIEKPAINCTNKVINWLRK